MTTTTESGDATVEQPPDLSTTVYVAEGWWHPNCKSGQVHDHPKEPKGSWSVANHRTCVEVYTKRKTTAAGRPRIVVDADCPSCRWPERWALLPDLTEPGPLFGCPKCDYVSESRDA